MDRLRASGIIGRKYTIRDHDRIRKISYAKDLSFD